MSCCVTKNYYSPQKNRILLLNTAEIRRKTQVRQPYCNLYAYGTNNPVRYIDPDGEFAVGVALSITVLTLATYYALLNYYQNPEVQEANRQLVDAASLGIEIAKERIKNVFSKSKNKNDSEAKPADESSALPKDGAESGKQSLPDMKKNPQNILIINHPKIGMVKK